ncbi:MAG: response regulator transcription factor [Aerococcaceae bacterium]|nr:response regulator transcription factor [Aerococcaceae bacterium]
MRVLIAEDDRDIAELLTIYLMNEGYQVENAYDGEEALQRINEEGNFDLMLLDVMMPKVDGFTVVEKVRKNNNPMPIIILSARTNDTDKIRGFLLGADDYVSKPFNPVEVIARIKAIARRSQKEVAVSSEYTVISDVVKMREYDRKLFTLDDIEIRLTNYEYQIFALLVAQPDKAFSAKEIYEKVWHNHGKGSPKSVLVHVSHLRDKILQATGSNLIQTVWGVGYKIKE